MSRHLYLLFSLVLLWAAPLTAAPFEGTLRMTLSDGRSAPMPLTYSVKGDKLRTEVTMEGMTMVAIMDTTKNEIIMLMPGQPMYMVMPMQEAATQVTGKTATDATIDKTGETETILGYLCTKYLVSSEDGVVEMWATDKLGKFIGLGGALQNPMGGSKKSAPSWERALAGRDFFPLRISSVPGAKQTFRLEVTAVEAKSLPDSDFVAPPGHQRMNMGGMMPGMRPRAR